MKLDPHLPQLPSIGELLEHPRVKSVVARINRSTLAHRATGFLDELRHSLAERAGRVEVPSVSQLAERLARRLLGEPPAGGPIINATGIIVGDPELTPPLADRAVEAMIQVAGEYHNRGQEMRRAAESLLCELTGGEAALVLGSVDAALNVVLAVAAANREVLVLADPAASTAGEWRKLAARHGVVLQIGNDLMSSSESSSLAALIRTPEVEGRLAAADVAAVAKQHGAAFVDVQPLAGLFDPQTYGLQSLETIQSRLQAGADLVVCDGSGLIGGPLVGLIIGKRALVEAAATHYLTSMATVDAASAAALHTTLSTYREDHDGSAAFAIPVWQLLSAPRDNLKQRAERLAALIAASKNVASAEPVELQRPWQAGRSNSSAPTWTIAVESKSGDATAVLKQLRQQPHPIVATAVDGVVHLDLRSVFPRWDQRLVAAFEGAEFPLP
jgi:L-seryl-tRNA(Ser) seleniumtransferase